MVLPQGDAASEDVDGAILDRLFALLIERVAELKCKQPWSKIQRTIFTLQAIELHTSL